MVITIFDKIRLANCCEEMIGFIQSKEAELKKLLAQIQRKALSVEQSLVVIRTALAIEQIYFRVLNIIYLIENSPHSLHDNKEEITREVQRIQKMNQAVHTQYLNPLVKHATDVLNAYNTLREPAKSFKADAPAKKLDLELSRPQNSVIPNAALREHRQFKLKSYMELVKREILNYNVSIMSPPKTPQGYSTPVKSVQVQKKQLAAIRLKLTQLQVNSFIIAGFDIDRSITNDLDVYAQQKYRMLKNQHEPINVWLKIVTKATTQAQNNLKTVFSTLKEKAEQLENIEKAIVVIGVAAFLGPVGAELVDPVLSIFKKLGHTLLSKGGSGALSGLNLEGIENKDIKLQLNSFVQWALKSDPKGNPLDTITKHLATNPPNATLNLMQDYVDYKINGEAKIFSEMFQMDTQVWDGELPLNIVKARRHQIMEQYKLNENQTSWNEHYSPNEYKQLYSRVKTDLWDELTGTVDKIYEKFADQYVSAKGLKDITDFIKKQTFNDSKSGLASFEKGNYEALVTAIANEIELTMLVRYAVTELDYWRGKNKKTSDPIPSQDGKCAIARDWKVDYINREIFSRYTKWMVAHQQSMPNFFEEYDPLDDFRCTWFNARYTPQQQFRFEKVRRIIHEYYTTPMDVRLLRSVQRQQPQNSKQITHQKTLQQHIVSTKGYPSNPVGYMSEQHVLDSTPQGIDKMHEWASEKKLHEEAMATLRPYISTYQTDIGILRAEKNYYYAHINGKNGLIKRTETNIRIEKARKSPAPSSNKL